MSVRTAASLGLLKASPERTSGAGMPSVSRNSARLCGINTYKQSRLHAWVQAQAWQSWTQCNAHFDGSNLHKTTANASELLHDPSAARSTPSLALRNQAMSETQVIKQREEEVDTCTSQSG